MRVLLGAHANTSGNGTPERNPTQWVKNPMRLKAIFCFDRTVVFCSHGIKLRLTSWYVAGGSKNVPLDKMQFIDNRQRLIYRERFLTALKLHRNIFIGSKLQLLQYSAQYFKITPKMWTVTCNVQCFASLNSLPQSTFEMSTPAFTGTQKSANSRRPWHSTFWPQIKWATGLVKLSCTIHLPCFVMICPVVFLFYSGDITYTHTHMRTERINALLPRKYVGVN